VDRQHRLLPLALHRHEARPGPRHRFTDRFGVILVILLVRPIGLDPRHRHQPSLVPQLPQLPRPVVRAATGFPPHQTRRQLRKIAEYFAPRQLLTDDDFAVRIHAVHLETLLRDVESEAFYLHGRVPLLGM
jgi:hypothetical protein